MQAVFQMTVFIPVLDILSDLMYIKNKKKTDKLSKTNILLSWQLLSGHTHTDPHTHHFGVAAL